jgi:hypothetical protein
MTKEVRICESCGKTKPINEFSKSYKHRCKECVAESEKEKRNFRKGKTKKPDVEDGIEDHPFLHTESINANEIKTQNSIDWEKMRNDQFVNGYNNLANYINEMDIIPINEEYQYLDKLMRDISEQLNRFSACKTDYLKYIKTKLYNKEQFNIWASGSPILDISKIPNVFNRIDNLIYDIDRIKMIEQLKETGNK